MNKKTGISNKKNKTFFKRGVNMELLIIYSCENKIKTDADIAYPIYFPLP